MKGCVLQSEQRRYWVGNKISIRTLFLLVFVVSIVVFVVYQNYFWPRNHDRPFATAKLDKELEIRLWDKPNFYSAVKPVDAPGGVTKTISLPPKTGRSLFIEVREHDEIAFPLSEMKVDLTGPADSVAVAYSEDRRFAAVYAENNPDILVLADLHKATFVSPMTIASAEYQNRQQSRVHYTFTLLEPGPVERYWRSILDSIQSANPEINIDWKRY